MSITVYPVTPHFAAEIGDVDLSQAARGRRSRRDQGGVLEIRGADLSGAGSDAGAASRVLGEVRARRERAHARSQSDAEPVQRRIRRHLESRGRRQDLGRDQPPAHVQGGQQALAYRQLVQASAEPVLAAVFAHHRARRRPHRVRGPARGIRCAARCDESESCKASSSSTGSCTRAAAADSPNSTRRK